MSEEDCETPSDIRRLSSKRVGLAIFPISSFLNHSCQPNSIVSFSSDLRISIRGNRSPSNSLPPLSPYFVIPHLPPIRFTIAPHFFSSNFVPLIFFPLTPSLILSPDRSVRSFSSIVCPVLIVLFLALLKID